MNGRILVVDDEEVVRNSLAAYLQAKGHNVETAEDGEAGLSRAGDRERFDLVITDLSMPKMDGLTFLQKLRSSSIDLPLIVMTGYATVENAIQALKEGATDFVRKPLQFEELSLSIRRILDKSARIRKRYDAIRLSDAFKFEMIYRTATIDFRAIRYYVEDVLSGLDSLTHVEVANVTLAFEEALTNAHEHGNLELPSSIKSAGHGGWDVYDQLRRERLDNPHYNRRKLRLRLRWNPPCLEFRLSDQGLGFDYRVWSPQSDVTKSHGRGLAIIYGVMDEVQFNETGTQITMRKYAGEGRE